jgi:methylenetetrahydrofolate dehydrogenase (NAD+)
MSLIKKKHEIYRLFSLYHNVRFLNPHTLAGAAQVVSVTGQSSAIPTPSVSDNDGKLVKAILPCTPLAIVKTLEHCQVYNPMLPYGSRAYGKTITVVNRYVL